MNKNFNVRRELAFNVKFQEKKTVSTANKDDNAKFQVKIEFRTTF